MRLSTVAVASVVGLILGCANLTGGDDKKDAAPAPAPAPTPAVTPAPPPTPAPEAPAAGGPGGGGPGEGPAFETVAVRCCTNTTVNDVLREYLQLHQALATSSDKVKSAVYGLDGVVKDAKSERGVDSKSETEAKAMSDITTRLKDKEPDAVRAEFNELSKHMMEIARLNRGGDTMVAFAHCMKNDSYWIQDDATVMTPYSDFPMCGRFVPAGP